MVKFSSNYHQIKKKKSKWVFVFKCKGVQEAQHHEKNGDAINKVNQRKKQKI